MLAPFQRFALWILPDAIRAQMRGTALAGPRPVWQHVEPGTPGEREDATNPLT